MKPLTPKEKNSLLKSVREDLKSFHQDWNAFAKHPESLKTPELLKSFSEDILKIYQDAIKLEKLHALKEESDLVKYILTTSWGAPFVEEANLLSAAKTFLANPKKDSDLSHLLKDFANFSNVFHNQLYCVLEDFESRIKKEEKEK